jgi:hypothetical protein
MDNRQPAVDFLLSITEEVPAPEIPFGEWYAFGVDAERGDNIRDHPEAWETTLELPPELRELSVDDPVAVREFDGPLNLNALAIGLGLERVQYEPEKFSGLVYREPEASVFVYGDHLCFALGNTEQDGTEGIEQLLDAIDSLGLGDSVKFAPQPTTGPVSQFISPD